MVDNNNNIVIIVMVDDNNNIVDNKDIGMISLIVATQRMSLGLSPHIPGMSLYVPKMTLLILQTIHQMLGMSLRMSLGMSLYVLRMNLHILEMNPTMDLPGMDLGPGIKLYLLGLGVSIYLRINLLYLLKLAKNRKIQIEQLKIIINIIIYYHHYRFVF